MLGRGKGEHRSGRKKGEVKNTHTYKDRRTSEENSHTQGRGEVRNTHTHTEKRRGEKHS